MSGKLPENDDILRIQRNGKLCRDERLKGRHNFALFACSRQYRGGLFRISVLNNANIKYAIEKVYAAKARNKCGGVIAEHTSERTAKHCVRHGKPAEEMLIIDRKVAFVAGKKCAPLAVDRNKVKRKLRELYRQHRDILPTHVWVMIIASSGTVTAGYDALGVELSALFKKIASENACHIRR